MYIYIYIYTYTYIYIYTGNDQIFTIIAPEILAKNFHFLVTFLGFPEISDAVLMLSQTDTGAKTLSGSVPSLMKDLDKIIAAGCLSTLMVKLILYMYIHVFIHKCIYIL
jgi:hypothetical protein